MLADARAGKVLQPGHAGVDEAETYVRDHKPSYLSYADWQKLDAYEIAQGQAANRPRVKLTRIREMLDAAGKKGE
jgi:ferredoxin--NADP+ reductase